MKVYIFFLFVFPITPLLGIVSMDLDPSSIITQRKYRENVAKKAAECLKMYDQVDAEDYLYRSEEPEEASEEFFLGEEDSDFDDFDEQEQIINDALEMFEEIFFAEDDAEDVSVHFFTYLKKGLLSLLSFKDAIVQRISTFYEYYATFVSDLWSR